MKVHLLYKMTCGHPETFKLHDMYATYDLAKKYGDKLNVPTYIKSKRVVCDDLPTRLEGSE